MDIIYKERTKIGEILNIKYGMRVFPYFYVEFVRLGDTVAVFLGLFHENINLCFDIRISWIESVLERLEHYFDHVEKKMSVIMDDMEVYYHPDINPVKFDGSVKIWGQKTTLGKSSDLVFKETIGKVKEHLDIHVDECKKERESE